MSDKTETGYRVISHQEWYGPGYCGICGDSGPNLIPMAVRWWCPDDGWKMGVLCGGCSKDARNRPPRPSDYAYRPSDDRADRIDVTAASADLDCAYADSTE